MIKHAIFMISAFAFCSSLFSQNDEKANILATEKSTADAFTKHNVIFLNTVFTNDATIITAKGAIINKQQLLQMVSNINTVVVSDMQVKIIGTASIVTGIESETGKDDVGVYSNKFRFTDILQKTKGQWQITSSQATSMDQ